MSEEKETTSEEITKEISPAEKFKNEANEYFKRMYSQLFMYSQLAVCMPIVRTRESARNEMKQDLVHFAS